MNNRWIEPMREALALAHLAVSTSGDVPVGAVLVNPNGEVVATGKNERELSGDPTAHAEIVAIRAAAALEANWHLNDLTLVVTLEPCAMCAGAIQASRIGRVVFGAWDERVGASGSRYDLLRDSRLGSEVEVIAGVLEEECAAVMRQFFDERRISGSK
jgi:tRNA(adenine34) deaminase